jgi:hypothetical protein
MDTFGLMRLARTREACKDVAKLARRRSAAFLPATEV